MNQPNKKQKVEADGTSYKEAVLFNSDTLSKIISYLPSVDLLNLGLTCKRFGISNNTNEDSIIKESTLSALLQIATEEQLAALPHYNGESSLADYHYLQLVREPLTFDQLVGAEFVDEEDKTCVINSSGGTWGTAFSNNILRAGKHYVSFEVYRSSTRRFKVLVGLMRPGKASQNMKGTPLYEKFFTNFTRRLGYGGRNSKVHCCMYSSSFGNCSASDWGDPSGEIITNINWDGMESVSSGDEIGMLLDSDEGTLSVYKNGRKLRIMQRGLAGPYCWVVSMWKGSQVTIKRGTIPP